MKIGDKCPIEDCTQVLLECPDCGQLTCPIHLHVIDIPGFPLIHGERCMEEPPPATEGVVVNLLNDVIEKKFWPEDLT